MRLGETWSAASGSLCPLFAGTTFADFARPGERGDIILKQVVVPVLLAPFAADVSRVTGRGVRIEWSDTIVVVDGSEVSGDVHEMSVADVCVSLGAELGTSRKTQTRASPSSSVWAKLGMYAERTYAPATEASRMKGAGAGISDND